MKNPHTRLTLKVIDDNGYYITHVLFAQDRYRIDNWVPYAPYGVVDYTLKEGEKWLDAPLPDFRQLCRPRWVDSKWIEGATDEELTRWNTPISKIC